MAVMPESIERLKIPVQGKREYLPVAARVLWFRMDHPSGTILTEPIEINNEKQYAVFKAIVMDGEGKTLSHGTKREDVRGFADWLEKAEAGAVGRALGYAGYGTLSEDVDTMAEPLAAKQVDSSMPARPPRTDNPDLPTTETLKIVCKAAYPEHTEAQALAEVWRIAEGIAKKKPTDEQASKWPVNQGLIDKIIRVIAEEGEKGGK